MYILYRYILYLSIKPSDWSDQARKQTILTAGRLRPVESREGESEKVAAAWRRFVVRVQIRRLQVSTCFHRGYPLKWMLHKGKSHLEMDDEQS